MYCPLTIGFSLIIYHLLNCIPLPIRTYLIVFVKIAILYIELMPHYIIRLSVIVLKFQYPSHFTTNTKLWVKIANSSLTSCAPTQWMIWIQINVNQERDITFSARYVYHSYVYVRLIWTIQLEMNYPCFKFRNHHAWRVSNVGNYLRFDSEQTHSVLVINLSADEPILDCA